MEIIVGYYQLPASFFTCNDTVFPQPTVFTPLLTFSFVIELNSLPSPFIMYVSWKDK